MGDAVSGTIDLAGAQRALMDLIVGESQIIEVSSRADVAREKANNELRVTCAQAEQTYALTIDQGRAAIEQQLADARIKANQLAGQRVRGLFEYATEARVPANVGWSGDYPREIAELQNQFDSLTERGQFITDINRLDTARENQSTPTLRRTWLGVIALGTILILFF